MMIYMKNHKYRAMVSVMKNNSINDDDVWDSANRYPTKGKIVENFDEFEIVISNIKYIMRVKNGVVITTVEVVTSHVDKNI